MGISDSDYEPKKDEILLGLQSSLVRRSHNGLALGTPQNHFQLRSQFYWMSVLQANEEQQLLKIHFTRLFTI